MKNKTLLLLASLVVFLLLAQPVLAVKAPDSKVYGWKWYPIKIEETITLTSGLALAPHLWDWYFDGENDYIVVPLSDSLKLFYAVSLELLVKPRAFPTNYNTVLGMGTRASGGLPGGAYACFNAYTSGKICFQIYNASVKKYIGAYVEKNAWNHVVFTYDYYTREAYAYVNGEKVNYGSDWGEIDTTQYKNIYISYKLPYNIAFARIYNRTTSSQEIDNSYSNHVVNASKMVLFLDATFYNGTHYIDLSPYGNNGTPYNGVSRVEADEKWIWKITNLYNDDKVHLLWFPKGTYIVFKNSTTEVTHVVQSNHDTLSLADGTYAVTVYVPPLNTEENGWYYIDMSSLVEQNYVRSDLKDVYVIGSDEVYVDAERKWIIVKNPPSLIYFGNQLVENNIDDNVVSFFYGDSFDGWQFETNNPSTGSGSIDPSEGNPAPSLNITWVNPSSSDYCEWYIEFPFKLVNVSIEFNIMERASGAGYYLRVYADNTQIKQHTGTDFADNTWYTITCSTTEMRKLRIRLSDPNGDTIYFYIDNINITGTIILQNSIAVTAKEQVNPFYVVKLFYENGTAYGGVEEVRACFGTGSVRFSVNGTGHVAFENQPDAFMFSKYGREVRVSSNFATVELYAPYGTYYDYSFKIRDFAFFVKNPTYLIVQKDVNGQVKTIDEKVLDSAYTAMASLNYGDKYIISLFNGEEQRTIGYVYADSDLTKYIFVYGIKVSDTTQLYDIWFETQRIDNTTARIIYQDTTNSTQDLKIYVYNKTMQQVALFENFLNPNNVTVTINALNATEEYYVKAVVTYPERTFELWRSIPLYFEKQGFPVNLEFIGSFGGIDVGTMVPLFLVLAVAGAFGAVHAGAGLVLAVGLSALFTYWGWLDIPYSLLSMLFSIAVIFAVAAAKKRWA